jgi:phosphate transporter
VAPQTPSTKLSFSRLEGNNFGSDGGSAIELEEFVPESHHRQCQQGGGHNLRDEARLLKRDRKLQRLVEEADNMKFSHSIQFNAVPEWSNNYIAYSNLKKL